MSISCRLFGHRRSKAKRVRIDYRWHSECRWCGIPMVRHGPQGWRPGDDRPSEQALQD